MSHGAQGTIVAIYESPSLAEAALMVLDREQVGLTRVSIAVGAFDAGERSFGRIIRQLHGLGIGAASGQVLAALTSAGVPDPCLLHYQRDVKAGRFLILAQGTARELKGDRLLLMKTGASRLDCHPPDSDVGAYPEPSGRCVHEDDGPR